MQVVTGSFGYIGRAITARLLAGGQTVRTITTHPLKPNPFAGQVAAFPYDFDQPSQLTRHLDGCETLYNTYYIRFPHDQASFEQAVANTATMIHCARQAGVRRWVQISVTNPALDSPLPYYRGKAEQERLVRESGLSYAIIRPTLVFGHGDILVNNMLWLLRRFPVFPIFGDGRYRIQPVYLGDLAELAVQQGQEANSTTIDAVGPLTFSFERLVQIMAAAIKRRVRLVHLAPSIALGLGRLIGLALGDVLLTRDEAQGLMQNLLTSDQPPNAPTRFETWLAENHHLLGLSYASELARHFRWKPPPARV